ncbi:hypothetical protein PR202_gb18583 [Eleusine coracana subsp. coracana]|uniref:cDENN domain-containing protein n=1 Tax=Eleusine coracana subsp. coracana TaxID=191504 RepID=A0AAV5F5R7_ELECO|nr:hypothetical protein PR202_gb18583 [Eleusine coracana subsp. coracana]
MEEQEPSGEAASTAPEHRGQAEEGRSPREAEAFEDAVEESSTASASPVSCREGGADVSEQASPSSSPSAWGSQSHEPAAAEEMEAYGSPSASETGSAAMEGEESPSVSGFRAEPVRVDTGSEMSPSEQRAQGPEEEDEENLMATPDAGSPSREEPKSRVWSAPPSPMFSGSSESSSPLSQIKQQSRHVRTGSFQRFRQQMQRAWKWGPIGGGGGGERSPREQLLRTTVNIEAMANQKRQWYQIHSKAKILFKYPPGKRAEIREADLPSFCFPEGVKARLIERTPSMSDLNEVIFGQEHLCRDDLSFIFSLKVSDNAPLYGVCLHVQEIVQKAPGILGAVSPLNTTSDKPSRFLVSAPRCYCLLTRVPFFELHYEMLNSIIAQERLDRITQFASEIALAEPVPNSVKEQDGINGDFVSSNGLPYNDWTEHAVPVNSISGLFSSSCVPSERDTPSYLFRSWEPRSPESISASEISESSYGRELDNEGRQNFQQYDESVSENLDSRCDSFGSTSCIYDNDHTSPDHMLSCSPIHRRRERAQSMESLDSSVKGARSDDEDELNVKHEMIVDDEKVIGWAKAHNNEPLQIVCGYHALTLPPRGGEIVFRPLEHLQPVKYSRPGLSLLGFGESILDNGLTSAEKNEVNARLAAAEEAHALALWTTATICRVLSLESVLDFFTGVLLEKQTVVICPNLGVLSAIVLSIIPMIRPFQWQSLLLPVLPRKLIDFLDAPVPFIVKAGSLPQLPRYKELVSRLSPIHARLSCENALAKRHPIYKCNEVQAEAAWQFLNVMGAYLESFCSDLRFHTITNIQSNNDRVSLLLKDSFIDSFPAKDRPFMKVAVYFSFPQ